MVGVIIGTLSLVALVRVWRWGHHRGSHRRWVLRRLFERLDTTPGQEKVIAAAVEEVERRAWRARDGLFGARGTVAQALRGEAFDTAALNGAFDAQQATLDELKRAAREGLQQVHEALTPAQRGRLADLLEFGPRRAHGCGRHGPIHSTPAAV